MTVFRYAARAASYNPYDPHARGALFPLVLAGLLGLWALIAMAIACNPKLVAESESQAKASYVSCEPAGSRRPGQLLRCTVEAPATAARDI